MIKTRKRHILLLEVMIAIAIILMCIVPMLQPHIFMLVEEKEFIREVDLDRVVGLLYSDLLVEKFYRNTILWSEIESGEPRTIDNADANRLGYKGTYNFKVKLKKSKINENDYALDLVTVKYDFIPTNGKKTLSYSYDLFVQRSTETEDITQQDQKEPDSAKQGTPNASQQEKPSTPSDSP